MKEVLVSSSQPAVMFEESKLPLIDACKYVRGMKTMDCGDPTCITSDA